MSVTYTVQATHVSAIRAGDTVEIGGQLRTVCAKDIGRGFMGATLFGDSYRAGTVLVRRAVIHHARPNP